MEKFSSIKSLLGAQNGASQVALLVKEPTCQCRRCKRRGFDPWVGKILWRRAWQPTLVFLPGESHGQRSLAGYGQEGHKESDTTEAIEHAQTLLKVWPGAVSSVRGSGLTPCLMVFSMLLKFRT